MDMKPRMNLVEIRIFSLNNIPYQKQEQSRQKLGTFLENKVFQKSKFLKTFGLLFSKDFLERFDQFSKLKTDFENQNLEILEEVAHNIGKSDGDIIY